MRTAQAIATVNRTYSEFRKESEKLLDLIDGLRFSFETTEGAPRKEEHQIKKRD